MLKNYLKVAFKVLLRRKFFTFISLFGISLTLLVLLVFTALADHIFSPQAPEVLAGRSLGIYSLGMQGKDFSNGGNAGYLFLDRFVRPLAELPAVETVTVFTVAHTVASYHQGRKIESELRRTDGEYWRVMRFDFLEGGPFGEADDRDARFVAVISEAARERFFGGGKALGKTIEADGQRFEVVGVVANVSLLRVAAYGDIWVPIGTAKTDSYKRELIGEFRSLIVARDRADFPQIKAEVQERMVAARPLLDPNFYDRLVGGADTLFEALSRLVLGRSLEQSHPRRLQLILFGLAFLFLLLPTVNLVNINLSRILDRSSEIGVRRAFGASSATLVGQFLVENLVLTLTGGVLGLGFGALVLAGINASEVIPHARLAINFRIFLEAVATAVFFGLISGVYPALRMSRLNPATALQGRS